MIQTVANSSPLAPHTLARRVSGRWQWIRQLCLIALVAGIVNCALAGPPESISSGDSKTGTVQTGQTNLVTFNANAGDRVLVALAKTSGGAGFTPLLEIVGTDGVNLRTIAAPLAARLDIQARSTGSYTIRVSDANHNGTGGYTLQMLQIPGTFTVPADDEGGALTNGGSNAGTIAVGDLDAWTVTANAGERIALQLAEVSGGAAFTPMLELFGPDGTRLAFNFGSVTAHVEIQAALTGTYTAVVSDANSTGSGKYELRLAHVPGVFDVPAGDDGGALADGDVKTGTISVGDIDLWTISLDPGFLVTVKVTKQTGGAGFTPKVEVLTPTGDLKAASQDAANVSVSLATEMGGTYTVLVRDATGDGSGTYQITRVATTSGASGPNVLVNGGIYPGNIATAKQEDKYTFLASAGENLVVRVGKTTSAARLVPQVRLYDPNGTLLDTAANSFAGEVTARATNSGTFMVSVRDNNGGSNTGEYRLSFLKTGSPLVISPSASGGTLTNGATHLGSIDTGALNGWSFIANAGDSVVVRMGEITTGSLTPQLRLFDPSGAQLDISATTIGAEVSTRATNSGSFLVIAGDQSGNYVGTGNYRLTMLKTGSALNISAGDEGGALTNGLTHLGSIDTGDMDGWTVSANAGDTLILRMGETVSSSLTPQLRLFDPSGAQIDISATTIGAEVTARATNSGSFLVIAADQTGSWAGTGNYRLSLAQTGVPLTISPGDEGGTLTNGTTNLGTIDVGDIDAWTINATAGESIVVRMGKISSTLTPEIRLYDPSGVLLDNSATTIGAEVAIRATNSGPFLLVSGDRTGSWAGSGNYRLTMIKTGSPLVISSSDEGGAMANGTTYPGAIDTGDIDGWTFDARAGQTVVVRMGEVTSGSTLTPQLRLFDPNGLPLETQAAQAAAEVVVHATNNGTFLVIAGDQTGSWAGTGNYRLTMVKTEIPLAVSAGHDGGPMTGAGVYNARLEVGDLNVWSFTACKGETIDLKVQEAATGSNLVPWLRLYSPEGDELKSVASQASVTATVVAPSSGTYTLLISDRTGGWAGSGTYQLTATGLIDELKFCPLSSLGTGIAPTVIGGLPAADYTVLTTTNVNALAAEWLPVLTNQFNLLGTSTVTNWVSSKEPHRYFQIRH